MSGAEALEKEIAAVANKAPRVTLADVTGSIISETYTLLPNGRTTICQLTLKNGFTVEGQSAAVSKENYNEEIGNKVARDNAVREIWPLMGHALAERLHGEKLLLDARAFEEGWDMEVYIGTKVIHAQPMNRLEYIQLRGWTLPKDENPFDEGYLVEYTDRIDNHIKGFKGYISWSPKDVFERAYRRVGASEPSAASANGSPVATGASVEKEEEIFEGIGAIVDLAPKEGWLDRLRKERHDLANKIMKLDAFVEHNAFFLTLPEREQSDQKEQASFMRGYLAILDRRLERAQRG
jgi:hypothetical protein